MKKNWEPEGKKLCTMCLEWHDEEFVMRTEYWDEGYNHDWKEPRMIKSFPEMCPECRMKYGTISS